jgi:hypothetical protein
MSAVDQEIAVWFSIDGLLLVILFLEESDWNDFECCSME